MFREQIIAIIAETCHEVNRNYCRSIGDDSQVSWDEAPTWQQASVLLGVEFHIANPDAGPAASHESWLAEKTATGWCYGKQKDEVLKTHPCYVPYEELPTEQKSKDYIFCSIVNVLWKNLKPLI